MGLTIVDMHMGQKASLSRIFTEEDVKACNELTKDFNPVYQPDEEIWKRRYSKPVVPGLLTEGLITQVIRRKIPGGPCILLQKEFVFYRPVHIGDEITAEIEVIDINTKRNWVTQKVTCFNQEGTEVLKGQVVILVQANDRE